jgi:hypothetical protein
VRLMKHRWLVDECRAEVKLDRAGEYVLVQFGSQFSMKLWFGKLPLASLCE